MQVRNIMVATDLSVSADAAIREADRWARRAGAELSVCHVMPILENIDPLFPQRGQELAERLPGLRERVAEEIEDRMRDLADREPGKYALILEDGKPHVGILDAADRVGADLVVIASRGLTGVSRLLAGSVASKVVRHARASVLLVRPSPKTGIVLAATDFSHPAIHALEEGANWAKRLDGTLKVAHAVEMPMLVAPLPFPYPSLPTTLSAAELSEVRSRAKRALHDAVGSAGLDAEIWVLEGPPAASIASAAEEMECELVVVGTAGKTGFSRVALGSVAERVAAAAPCSVLVVRRRANVMHSAA